MSLINVFMGLCFSVQRRAVVQKCITMPQLYAAWLLVLLLWDRLWSRNCYCLWLQQLVLIQWAVEVTVNSDPIWLIVCSRACHHTPQPALSLHFSGGNLLYLSSPVPLPVTTPHSQRTVMYAACGVWWQKEVEERRAGSVEFALFWWQQIHKHTIISYSSMSGLKLYSYKGRFVFLW